MPQLIINNALMTGVVVALLTSCSGPEGARKSETETVGTKSNSAMIGSTKELSGAGVQPIASFQGVFVGLSFGMVKLTVLVDRARAYLSQEYADFRQTKQANPLVEFRPQSPRRCVTFLFGGNAGEPYWQVSFDSEGRVSEHRAGSAHEGRWFDLLPDAPPNSVHTR
jgi:hypothetical protein